MIEALKNSIIIALVATPICIVLGTLAAVGISRFRYILRAPVAGLVGAPLVVPWLLIGVGGLRFFSRLHVPLSLQTIGVMQVVSIFPLVTAIVAARLVRFDTSLEEAARDLGATQWEVLRYIVLPLIAPASAAAAIFAFSWSFNNFTISYFTAGFPVDVPDLGVLEDDAQPREERADRERDLDARGGRAGRDPVRGLAAQPPLAVAGPVTKP